MPAQFKFYTNLSEIVVEPALIEDGFDIQLIIENVGDELGRELGFYIKPPSTLGDVDYPSIDSTALNYSNIVGYGNSGYGIKILQGLELTQIKTGAGDDFLSKIPLTAGLLALPDQIVVGEYISIHVSFDLPPGTPIENLYVDFVIS